jgi:hypothetical protein
MAALAPQRGPQRVLDLALRTGPYGDQFGRVPGGLSWRRSGKRLPASTWDR